MDLYVLKQRSKAVTKVGHKASPITLLYLSLYLSDVGNNTVTMQSYVEACNWLHSSNKGALSNVAFHKYTNTQMHKYTNTQKRKYTITHIQMYSSAKGKSRARGLTYYFPI